jgi:hypothetical protein
MKTKQALLWRRACTLEGSIEVPAGTPVEYCVKNNHFYIRPSFFEDAILRHDAMHYGCTVEPDNVEPGDLCAGCMHLTGRIHLYCLKLGYNISGTLERLTECKAKKLFQARRPIDEPGK